jgi:hypothetical protein
MGLKMNERLEKFAKQAPLLKSYDYPDLRLVDDDQLERFAELSVRECANYINERTLDWDADLRWVFNDGSGDMAVNVDDLLNRHFGVKE